MLIAKGVINTLAIDPHVLHKILDRRSLVTARPENLHGFVEDFIPIEFFLARHCAVSVILYTLSGTNSQESALPRRSHAEAPPDRLQRIPSRHSQWSCRNCPPESTSRMVGKKLLHYRILQRSALAARSSSTELADLKFSGQNILLTDLNHD